MLFRKLITNVIFVAAFCLFGISGISEAQNADLRIDSVLLKQVNGVNVPAFGPLVPGQTATFDITVRNDGLFPAAGASVVARLNNTDAVFVSSSSAATWNPPSAGLTFTRRNPMPVGVEVITVTVLVPHDAHYFALGAINFSATAHAGNPDSSGTSQTATTTDLAVRGISNLTIEKALLTPTVGTGGRALYDVSICNNGPSSVDGVGIIDTPGLNMNPGSALFNSDANSLYIPALGCERVAVSAEVAGNAPNGASFSNSVQVNTSALVAGSPALGANALAPTVNAPSDTNSSGTVFVASEEVNLRLLDVTLETVNSAAVPATGPIVPGLTAQFRIRVRNVGTTPANGVVVTGQLRGVPTAAVASLTLGQPWTQGSSGLTFARGESLAPGVTESLLVTLFIPADAHYVATGPVSFVAGVVAGQPDSAFGNNTASTPIINLKAISDLTIDKALLTKKVAPNGTALYNIEVCNRGFSDIKGLGINDVTGANLNALTLVLPATATTDSLYVPAANCIDIPASAQITSGAIAGSIFGNAATVDISNVSKGSLLLLGNVENPVVNAATDSDATGEVAPVLPNADVQIDNVRLVEVNGAAVGVGGPLVPGQTAKFEINIRNVGPDAALGTTLVNRFSNVDAKVVASTAPGSDWSPAGDGYTFTRLNPMPAGAAETITLTILVPTDAHYTTVGNLDLVSSLSAVNPETNVFNNSNSTGPLSVQAKVGLTLTTTLLSANVAPGGLVLAEAEICSSGPSDINAIKFATNTLTNIQAGSIKISAAPSTAGSYIEANRCVDALISAVVSPSAVVGSTFSFNVVNDNTMLVNGAAVLGGLAFPPSPLPNLTSPVSGTVSQYLPNANVEVVSTKLIEVNGVASPVTGPLVPGQRAQFEVVVRNNGPSPAQGVVLVNQLRALGSIVVASSSPAAPWSPVGTGLSFTRRDPMPANTTETLTFTVDIPSDAHYLATRRIQLNSFVTSDNPDQTPGNNRLDTGDINIKANADLSITKTLLTPQVAPGATAQYEITVCNSGPSDIDGIQVIDTVGTNLVTSSLVLSADANDLYIAAGGCVDVAASARVKDSAVVGASFANAAAVEAAAAIAGSGPLGVTALAATVNEPTVNNTVGVVANYLPVADLAVVSNKIIEIDNVAAALDAPLIPGLSATFEIVVKNNGEAPAEGVSLLNRIGNLEAFVVRSSAVGVPWTLAGDGLSFNRLEPMPAGATETLTITVELPSDAHYQALGGVIFSSAISGSNPDGSLMNNELSTAELAVQAKSVLSIDKQLLTPNVAPGGLAQYEITVCSSGPSDLQGLAVVDTVGTNLVSASLALSADASDFYLAANRCADFIATAQVSPAAIVNASFANTAEVDASAVVAAAPGVLSEAPEVNEPTDTDSSGLVANYLPNADIQVVSSKLVEVDGVAVPEVGPLVPGQRAKFEVVIKNNGPSPAEAVTLVNRLRGIDAVVTSSSSPGSPWSPAGSGLNFVRRNPMAANLTETVTFTVRIPSDAHYQAKREVLLSSFATAANPDQVTDNNRKNTPFLNFQAKGDLSIDKNLFTPRVAPGGTAQYEITVCNAGPSDIDGVEVLDTTGSNLVASTVILSADAKDLYVGAGRCVDVSASVQVSDASVVNSAFINNAAVETAGVIPGSSGLAATALTPVVNEPTASNTAGVVSEYLPNADVRVVSIELTEVNGSPTAGKIIPGQTAQFEIKVSNVGPAPAEAVTLLNRISNVAATVVEATSSSSTWNNGGAGLGFTRQNPLASGDTDTLRLTVMIPADAHYAAAGDIDFRSFVSASNPDLNLGNNRVTYNDFDVQALADLSITKTTLTTQAPPAATTLYEISVCNAGPSDVRSVKVTDLPGLNLVASSLVLSSDATDLYVRAGHCVDVIASVRIIDGAAPGASFDNTASLDVTMVDDGKGSTLDATVTAGSPSQATGIVSDYLPTADLQILEKRIVSGTLVPGSTATFEIDVINNGPAYAEGVIVTDTFSNVDFTFESSVVPANWNGAGASGTFTRYSPMKPGVKETLSLTVRIASDAHLTSNGTLSNTAYVVASNPDSNTTNNTATTGVLATQGQSVITLTKTLLGDFVLSDTPAAFEIEVCNQGPSDVHGLKITDTPGLNLDAKTLILSPGAMSLNVPADDCRSVTATVQVNYAVPSGQKFVNEAAVDVSGVLQGTGATLAALVNAPTEMAMGLVGPELFSISGRVEDQDGNGIANVTVSSGTGLSGITNSNGEFIINGVKSGTYNLDAIASNGTALGGKTVSVADANLTGVIIVAVQPIDGTVNFVWNGFLQQANILVLINKGDRMVDATIKLFDLNGNQTASVSTKLSPNSERDVIINDLPGFQSNSYGYLGVEFNNPKDFDGHMAFYRLSPADSRDVEFSIIKPFDDIQKGTSFGTFNTMQPSLNVAEKSNIVQQWIQIINLSNAVQQFTLTFYDQIGKEIRKDVVNVPARARRDFEGGHVNPGPGVVGTIKVEPSDVNAEYLAQIFRYGGDAPANVAPSSFSFAMGLATQKGGTGTQFAPLSIAKDSINFVVVTNVSGINSSVGSTGTSADGSNTFAQSLNLPAFGQAHLNADDIIAANEESGLLRLNSATNNLIIESTQYFYDPITGSVTTAFNTSGRSIVPGRNAGIYNNFLNADNMLKLHNTTNSPVSATLTLHDLAGNSVGTGLISIAPRGVAEIELTLGFRLPRNTYGLVAVESSVPGAIFSEILRTKQSLSNSSITDLAASIPVR